MIKTDLKEIEVLMNEEVEVVFVSSRNISKEVKNILTKHSWLPVI